MNNKEYKKEAKTYNGPNVCTHESRLLIRGRDHCAGSSSVGHGEAVFANGGCESFAYEGCFRCRYHMLNPRDRFGFFVM